MATIAKNTKLVDSTLGTWRGPTQAATITKGGTKKTIYRFGQLLAGESATPESLTNYLTFAFGSSTTITVDANGADSTPVPSQTIVLDGVDLSATYGSTDAGMVISGMLGDGTLKVDSV